MAELIADTTIGSLADKFEEVARLAVRLALQSALEAEVTVFFGGDRYARGERERDGSRNGSSPVSIKSTAGEVTLQRPKVRGTAEVFASRLLGIGVTRTNALESLVIAGFVRGLSVRDVEASLADALGPDATISKSTVSRVCEQVKEEFDVWKTAAWPRSSWTTCSPTGASFGCTPARRPSRCWSPGASPPPASRCCWALSPATPSPPTPGPASWVACGPAGCVTRCWSSPTAAPG